MRFTSYHNVSELGERWKLVWSQTPARRRTVLFKWRDPNRIWDPETHVERWSFPRLVFVECYVKPIDARRPRRVATSRRRRRTRSRWEFNSLVVMMCRDDEFDRNRTKLYETHLPNCEEGRVCFGNDAFRMIERGESPVDVFWNTAFTHAPPARLALLRAGAHRKYFREVTKNQQPMLASDVVNIYVREDY